MKLSVIISNRNDIVMLNVTLNSVLEALKLVRHKCEIVVVDNSDEEVFNLIKTTFPSFFTYNGIKLIRQTEICFTKARMRAAHESQGEYLFCIDSHVLLGCNTLRRSISFMDSHKDEPIGFGHPPMRWSKDGPGQLKQSMGIAPGGSPYTKWISGKFTKDSKIFWKFMPWICNREWYLNDLKGYGSHADHGVSWGGAELLQQIKSWMLGYENWYIHTDPVIHIGPYNKAVYATGQTVRKPYKNSGNYPEGFGILLALYVLAGESIGYEQALLAKVRIKRIHKLNIDKWWPKAVELGKVEYEWLMSNKRYDFLELLEKRPWEEGVR